MTERTPKYRPYITVTSGMRGFFAVMIDGGPFPEPILSGIGSYDSPEGAMKEAREWAAAEGLECR